MQTPLDQAVQQHGATVLRVCRAVLGVGPDAEDAWSETFLAAFRAWPGLPDDTNIEAWLVRVAHRKAIDVTRTRARRAVPTDTLPEKHAHHGVPDVGYPDLWQAVAALPERQRLAIAYYYLGGLSHGETAELIGGSPESVRRAAADGMRTLRKIYPADRATKEP